jgi:hypothetical protein
MTLDQKREHDRITFLKRRCSQRNDVHGDYHKDQGPSLAVVTKINCKRGTS